MSNGELHAREREDLSLERYAAVTEAIAGLRQQAHRIEAAIWSITAILVTLGAGSTQIAPILRALAQTATP